MNSSAARTSSSLARVLGIGLSRSDLVQALAACEARLGQSQGGSVFFVNVHTATDSTSNSELRRAFAEAFLLLADGVPLLWAARLKGVPIASRVCGPDFMAEFLKRHPEMLHGFVGGRPGVAEKLAVKYGLEFTHFLSPPVRSFSVDNAREDWQRLLETCGNGVVPRVVWVGLGAPKQELWIREVSRFSPETLFFGVGAAFDFLSGGTQRAPYWMQRVGLEWFYRLCQEPGRLWKRYLTTNSRFLSLLAKDLVKTWLGGARDSR